MLILLPPSEGKATAGSGAAVDLASLSLPTLAPAREAVLTALVRLCDRVDPAPARTVLGLGAGQDAEVRRNAALLTAPAAPAGQVYTGVLYEALGLRSLPTAARRRVLRWALVFSGLWGALRLDDRIPPYRCPIGVRLPGLGGLAGHWRRALATALPGAHADAVVLDLRSGAYAGAWVPPPGPAARTVVLRVLHERDVDGVPTRTVVSHFNKAVKGALVRELALAGVRPRSPRQLVAALADLGHQVVEREPAANGSRRVDLVVRQLQHHG